MGWVRIELTWLDFQSSALTNFATNPNFQYVKEQIKKASINIEAFQKIFLNYFLYQLRSGLFPLAQIATALKPWIWLIVRMILCLLQFFILLYCLYIFISYLFHKFRDNFLNKKIIFNIFWIFLIFRFNY